jgi:hypothetical protein
MFMLVLGSVIVLSAAGRVMVGGVTGVAAASLALFGAGDALAGRPRPAA